MSNISVADQLDEAIEAMIAEDVSVPLKADLAMGELLGIAAELRMLPDPEFKAALKTELIEFPIGVPAAGWQGSEGRGIVANAGVSQILPTLIGTGDGAYPVHRGSFAVSAAIHVALLAGIATTGVWMAASNVQPAPHSTSVVLTELVAPVLPAANDQSGGGGGGGDHDKLSDSHGNLPRFAPDQIAPPAIVVRNEHPRLPVEPTIVGLPELTMPQTSQVGNPLSAILQPSNGTGSGGGIGSGQGGGIGSGFGPGFGPGHGGGAGGGAFRVGGGVSAPKAIYDPDPEYSEEARRAKFQGTVLLWVVVGVDGRPRDIRVQRSVGMGLDEKAIEAVRQWRFEPSMMDGHPVASQVNIEVSFRLY